MANPYDSSNNKIMLRNVTMLQRSSKLRLPGSSPDTPSEGAQLGSPPQPAGCAALKRAAASMFERDNLASAGSASSAGAPAGAERPAGSAERSAGSAPLRFGSSYRIRVPTDMSLSSPLGSPKMSPARIAAPPTPPAGSMNSPGRPNPSLGKPSVSSNGSSTIKLPNLLGGGESDAVLPRFSFSEAGAEEPRRMLPRPSANGLLGTGGSAPIDNLVERLDALENKAASQAVQLIQMSTQVANLRHAAGTGGGDAPAMSGGGGGAGSADALAMAREAMGEVASNSVILNVVRQQVAKLVSDQPLILAAAKESVAEALYVGEQAQSEVTANSAVMESLLAQVSKLQAQLAEAVKPAAVTSADVAAVAGKAAEALSVASATRAETDANSAILQTVVSQMAALQKQVTELASRIAVA